MIQRVNNLDRFAPCEDMFCYDFPNDFFNQESENAENIDNSVSILYLIFKYIIYLLFGCTLLTLGCSISTLIVMATDNRNALDNEEPDSTLETGSDSESDAESEYDESNYHHKYVKELNSLLNALESIEENENKNEQENENQESENTNKNETKTRNRVELTNEMKSSLSDRILMETTPKGNVIMYYNHDAEDEERSSFHYYCDDKSLPFNYLDTVSRKYVCLYKCPQIYRYLEKEMETTIQKMKEREELENKRQQQEEEENIKNEENVRKRSDSVFATLKNYKTQNQNKIISGAGGSGRKRVINVNQLLLCKNRYKRLGSIEEYHLHLKMKEIKEQEPINIKPISFSEYKKMNQVL